MVVNIGITNKVSVVVYIKLWTVAQRIVRRIKNLTKRLIKKKRKNSVSLVWTRCVLKKSKEWFENLCYKDITNNYLVIVIVYAMVVNIGITNKVNFVVYFKLWTVAQIILRTLKNLTKRLIKKKRKSFVSLVQRGGILKVNNRGLQTSAIKAWRIIA